MKALGRTALYMRLSRDDEKAGESLSIENQRTILRRYAGENGGAIVGEYIDDGCSGTDFERPAAKRLLCDAKDGKIDTIVVKDLSRFGRNYIQVGQYIDYIFPACGIRFIALSDNVDTADRASAGMDMMPIMNVFNEWHAANTSKKIRAVLEADWRKGKCTAWAYPYGYRAGDDADRTAVIDERAANVVRRIFDMRLQGNSASAIARVLTAEGIPNPSAHYTRLDGRKSERRNSPCWSPKTVADILKNSTYIGTLTQHRTTRLSYKNHKVIDVPYERQIVKENAHEAIIDRKVFERVQAISKGVSRGRSDKCNTVHALSGLLVCADCGKKLKFKSSGRRTHNCNMFLCRTYVDLGKRYCSSHAITERRIESIVLQDIRTMLGEVKIDEEKARAHFLSKGAKRGESNRLSDEKLMRDLKGRLAELDKLIGTAFEDKVLGNLPESVCKCLCEKYQTERDGIECRLAEIGKRLNEPTADDNVGEYISRLKRYAGCEKHTREMCLQLIEFIAVGEKSEGGEPRQIHIYYKLMQGSPLMSEKQFP